MCFEDAASPVGVFLPDFALPDEAEDTLVAAGNCVRSTAARIHHPGSTSFRTTRDFSVSMDSSETPLENSLQQQGSQKGCRCKVLDLCLLTERWQG
jgi:hypothetical protein